MIRLIAFLFVLININFIKIDANKQLRKNNKNNKNDITETIYQHRINILKFRYNDKLINNTIFCNYLNTNWFDKMILRNFSINLTSTEINNIEDAYVNMVYMPNNLTEIEAFLKIYYKNDYYNSSYLKISESDVIDYYFSECSLPDHLQSNNIGRFLIFSVIIANIFTRLMLYLFDIKLN